MGPSVVGTVLGAFLLPSWEVWSIVEQGLRDQASGTNLAEETTAAGLSDSAWYELRQGDLFTSHSGLPEKLTFEKNLGLPERKFSKQLLVLDPKTFLRSGPQPGPP